MTRLPDHLTDEQITQMERNLDNSPLNDYQHTVTFTLLEIVRVLTRIADALEDRRAG